MHDNNTQVFYHPLYNDEKHCGQELWAVIWAENQGHAAEWDEDRKIHFTDNRNETL